MSRMWLLAMVFCIAACRGAALADTVSVAGVVVNEDGRRVEGVLVGLTFSRGDVAAQQMSDSTNGGGVYNLSGGGMPDGLSSAWVVCLESNRIARPVEVAFRNAVKGVKSTKAD